MSGELEENTGGSGDALKEVDLSDGDTVADSNFGSESKEDPELKLFTEDLIKMGGSSDAATAPGLE